MEEFKSPVGRSLLSASVIFHNLVQQDVTGILRYFADEADKALEARFHDTFLV